MIYVVDFDNTITRSTNGIDINKEMPEIRWEVVNHLEELKRAGHYLKVVTARGCLSCNNDMQKRIAKYYARVKYILDVNGIPYDELSFNKEYGEIYLDDSCGNVIYDDIEIFHNPNSKNTVVRYGNMIVKEGPTTGDEWKWYEKNNVFHTPENIYFNPKQKILYMKYIKPGIITDWDYSRVLRTAMNCKTTKGENDCWDKFVADTLNRSKLRLDEELLGFINDLYHSTYETMLNSYSEESHGDLTVSNIICSGCVPYVIDPVAPEGQYRGIWLDLGKFMFSTNKYFFPTYNVDFKECLKKTNYMLKEVEMDAIRLCAVLCFLRLSKYRNTQEDLDQILFAVKSLLK